MIDEDNAGKREKRGWQVRTFKEWYNSNEALVARFTVPFGHDNRVLRLCGRMLRVHIEKDDFRQVSVQI